MQQLIFFVDLLKVCQNMSQLKKSKVNRLQLLYKNLKENRLDIESIQLLYAKNDIIKSRRQIQRDLEDVIYFTLDSEVLDWVYEKRKKYFFINIRNTVSFGPTNATTAINFSESRFYYKKENGSTASKIDHILSAITHKKMVLIEKVITDSTGDNATFSLEDFLFQPEQLMYHRNSYYVLGFTMYQKAFSVFEINGLGKILETEHPFTVKNGLKKVQLQFKKRFGISKNIDDNVYTIVLEIASVLAKFLEQHYWHYSQKFSKHNGKHYLTLTCGINRELLGWLFQWMYNIKIIEPPLLHSLYEKSLEEMYKIHYQKIPLVYKNLVNSSEYGGGGGG